MSRSKSGWFVTSGQKSQSKMKITIYTTLYLTKWNCHGVQFFSMGFSDTSLCKICPNDHPGKVSSIVRVTLIGSELLFFDSIDVKLAQCKEMNYFLSHLTIPKLFLLKLTLMLALSILLCQKFTHDIVIQKLKMAHCVHGLASV